MLAYLNQLVACTQTTDTDERLIQVSGLEMRLRELEDEIRAWKSCCPKHFQQLTEEIAFARAAIERWTDNIAIIRKDFEGAPT